MRSTYTYVLLDVSPEAYREIRAKLEAAGYDHAIDGQHLDMHGIALNCDPLFELCTCGHPKADHQGACSTYAARCMVCFREQQQRVATRQPCNFVDCYHAFEPDDRAVTTARNVDLSGRWG